jgi:glycerophosphoryl diester phosphodiesterase
MTSAEGRRVEADALFPRFIAHRGAMAEAPENTRAAFDRALACGVDGIEFDVQLSRDGIPVVFHDADLKKINGSRKPVGFYRYSELCGMDWGGWFSDAHRGTPALTLEEVLLEYAARTRLLVEIKPAGAGSPPQRPAEIVAECILSRIRPADMEQILVLSFDPRIISAAAGRAPGPIYGVNLAGWKGGEFDLPGCVRAVSLPLRRISALFADRCHQQGLFAMTYSCNTRRQAQVALEAGIDGIMTDDPGQTAPLLQRR